MEYPVKITKIENQKKNKKRLSLFLDNEFAFGLDAAIVAQTGLKEGDSLTEHQITHILFQEEKKRVKEKAFRFLAARTHSEQELRIKLAQKGFENTLVEQVVTELKSVNLIDDSAFAISYARSRLINRSIGENLLRSELRLKGINDETIDKTVQEAYAEKSQCERARDLVDKKKLHYQNLEHWKKKKRIGDFLIRRGFDWDVVKEAVEEGLESGT